MKNYTDYRDTYNYKNHIISVKIIFDHPYGKKYKIVLLIDEHIMQNPLLGYSEIMYFNSIDEAISAGINQIDYRMCLGIKEK